MGKRKLKGLKNFLKEEEGMGTVETAYFAANNCADVLPYWLWMACFPHKKYLQTINHI